MFPAKFEYHAPTSLDEAIKLLSDGDGDVKVLAGGHSLLPPMKLRLAQPSALIDIGRLSELKGITNTRDGGIRIGALTTHAELAAAGDLPAVLSEAAGMIGDVQVRNRGTIGGNLAHADPASDLPTVMVALDATLHVVGPNGRRSIPASLFFLDLFTTGLEEGEIIMDVQIPDQRGAGSAYAK